MSSFGRIFSKNDTNSNKQSENDGDLERGVEATEFYNSHYILPATRYEQSPALLHRSPSNKPTRTSYSDSEFSRTEISVSADRYQVALEVIEGNSPTTQDLSTRGRNSPRGESGDGLPSSGSLIPGSPLLPVGPFVDVMVPTRDREIPARFSGFVDDGVSQRRMSRAELQEELRSTSGSLSSAVEESMKLSPLSRTTSQGGSQMFYMGPLQDDIFGADVRTTGGLIDLDPGSSQSSSSGTQSGRLNVPGLYKESSSSSRLRSPTPPLLYGAHSRSRLEKALKDAGIKGNGQEQDWETIADMKVNDDSSTATSRADTSDSGHLSVRNQIQGRYNSVTSRRAVLQPGPIHRHHQAFVFLRNGTTDRAVRVHQPTLNVYRHPEPLSGHSNPFGSSPPTIEVVIGSPGTEIGTTSAAMNKSNDRHSEETVRTESFDEMVNIFGSSSGRNACPELSSGDARVLKEREPPSSGWMSTVGEDELGSSQLPTRDGSFAKVTVLSGNGNLTGTPEGTGAREVGSSLAGASSPPSIHNTQLSSPLATPTPSREHRHLNTTPTPSPISPSKVQPLDSGLLPRTRRRRSSSESNCIIIASPSAMKASALQSPNTRGHKKRNTMTGLPSSRAHSPFHREDSSQADQHQSTLRERKGHLGNHERDSSSTSTESRPFLHEGVVHTDVPPPVFDHPVYGIELRPWDRAAEQDRGRPQARTNRYQRPVARVESPHLHRIPRPPTAEVLRRQKELSKHWAIAFCVLPPIALIFGHGYADEVIRIQTSGEIDTFTDTSKTLALYWGYAGTPTMVILLVLIPLLGGNA